MDASATATHPIAVLGASGYIGNRLVGELLARGHQVRALARTPRRLADRPWAKHPRLEVAQCDVDDEASLREALRGCRAAYYLIHRMQRGVRDFAAADHQGAQAFADVARRTPSLQQIIYLGGLGTGQPDLSRHLRSRHEVERVLQSSGVPVTVLRAAMVIGAGSASFEILRYLTDRLPLMIAPKWLYVPCQPIFVGDVVAYLAGCLGLTGAMGQSFDIGGPEVVTYRALIDMTAEASHLRRRVVLPVPVLTPRLSSYWIGLVTPVPAAIARPLAEGLRIPVICQEDRIRDLLPIPLTPVALAIHNSVGALQGAAAQPGDPAWAGGTLFVDHRERLVAAPRQRVWQAVGDLGGSNGWPGANWLWRLRGALDRLHGGPGLSGAVRPLRRGDRLDFWRIHDVRPPSLLQLRAELVIPGEGTLEFHLDREGGATRLTQRAEFQPRGLAGILYWHALRPIHAVVFGRLISGLQRRAARHPDMCVSHDVDAGLVISGKP